MTLTELTVLQGIAGPPDNTFPPLLFFESQKAPEGEKHNVTCKEMQYTSPKLHDLTIYNDKSLGNLCGRS